MARQIKTKQVVQQANEGHLMRLYGDGGWREQNKHVFPNDWALRMFLRQHRDDVLLSGAVVELAGSVFVNVPHFERVLTEVGARRLQQRVMETNT